MSNLFFRFLMCFFRALLHLRYRITTKGLENIQASRGTLFLPNHVALIDPIINFLLLRPKIQFQPLAVEYIANLWCLKILEGWMETISIPNFETGINEYKIKRAEQTVRRIAEGLKEGKNFLIYPSGQLKRSGKELLGGASIVYELLKECPDANVVLIRTTGLWGSRFSKAFSEKTPPFIQIFCDLCKIVCKNLFFFCPKRDVLIEYELNLPDLPGQNSSRLEMNRFLEDWYNRYLDAQGNVCHEEPLNLISYSMWRREVPEVFQRHKEKISVQIPEDLRAKIYHQIRTILDEPDLEIEPKMSFVYDLGMHSLNMAELITWTARNFGLREVHPDDLETVGSFLQMASEEHQNVGWAGGQREGTYVSWAPEEHRKEPAIPKGRTLMEGFLFSCGRMRHFSACGDDAGIWSYQKLKQEVLTLAQQIKSWEGDRVAVMLSASVDAYSVILAIQFAGKVPVMLNWTLGVRYLEEMVQMSGVQRIVTSWRFLEYLYNVRFGSCLDRFVLLEEMQREKSFIMRFKGWCLAHVPNRCVLRWMRLDIIDEGTPCVILFTSGTESTPKGVPLSHKNILSDMKGALNRIDVHSYDVLYSVLPPFHSFGFSATGFFPLLSGVRVCFYPSPTDHFGLIEGIQRWQVTLFLSTPGFTKGLIFAGRPEVLKTIRYFILGSEKVPQELYDKIQQMQTGAELLEGYGITECSPILSINVPHLPPKGVGHLLLGVEMTTIDPQTLHELPQGSEGEICVSGPTIFQGYLGDAASPFIEIQGKKWYRTGDLGHLESDQSLILSGRLKRFVKIGGEMISLGAIEEALMRHLMGSKGVADSGPCVAVLSKEKKEGGAQLILFTTSSLDQEASNQILHDAGFSNLLRISSVKKVEHIPFLASGKIDYRSLRDCLRGCL